ncbi:MAG: sodium:calcium antiporter [Candidatus Spechtbacterales bacterium]
MHIGFSVLAIVVGIFLLIQSGKRVVGSLGAMARFLGISEFVLSFVLVAFATSLPELTVGINSALLGISELSFGDILGTNVINFTLILGTVAIVGGNIALKDYEHFRKNRFFELALLLSPLVLMLDGALSRIDGTILLLLFTWNIIRLLDVDDMILGKKVFRPHLAEHVHHKAETRKEFFKNLAVFLASVTFLISAAILIVYSVRNLSVAFGLSRILVGVLVVGVGTSLPELTIGIRSVRRKMGGISLGDIFGSGVINSTLILGIVSLISPIHLENKLSLFVGLIFTVAAFLTVLFFLRKKKSTISRKEGFVLVAIYILFAASQLFVNL